MRSYWSCWVTLGEHVPKIYFKRTGREKQRLDGRPQRTSWSSGSQGGVEKGLSPTCARATAGPQASCRSSCREPSRICHSTSAALGHSLPTAQCRVASCPADSYPKTWQQAGFILLMKEVSLPPACGMRS